MARRVGLTAVVLSALCFLSACGGGGGGSDTPATGGSPSPTTPGGTATNPPATDGGAAGNSGNSGGSGPSWLTFSPASISQTVRDRSFTIPIPVTATSSRVIQDRLNVAIIDSTGVFDPSGTIISATGSASYKAELAVSAALKPGRYQGALTVRLCLDDARICQRPFEGSSWQIPFDIQVKSWLEPRSVHKLLATEVGVPLTWAPNLSRLTKSITVSDNLGQASRWQARSDQPWLTVTPSGAAGETLKVEADPSSLPPNSLTYATIFVSSPDASVTPAQPIVVGFWKSGDTIRQIPSKSSVPSQYRRTVADAIRPYVYAHTDGSQIDAYNIYTGALVGSLSAPGSSFGKMIVSPEGDFLYALDSTSSQVKVFDLRAGKLSSSWPLITALDAHRSALFDMVYARPNGVGVVVMTTGQIMRASDGKVLGAEVTQPVRWWESSSDLQSSYLAASPDGTRIYSTDSRQHSPNTPFYWDIDYSEASGGTLSFTKSYGANLSNGSDERLPQAGGIALSRDGTRVLMLSYQGGISVWSPSDLSRMGMLGNERQYEDGTLLVTADGNVIVEPMTYGTFSGPEFRVLSPDGTLLKRVNTTLPASLVKPGISGGISTWASRMAVSADGIIGIQRGYYQTDAGFQYLLTFTPIVP